MTDEQGHNHNEWVPDEGTRSRVSLTQSCSAVTLSSRLQNTCTRWTTLRNVDVGPLLGRLQRLTS